MKKALIAGQDVADLAEVLPHQVDNPGAQSHGAVDFDPLECAADLDVVV